MGDVTGASGVSYRRRNPVVDANRILPRNPSLGSLFFAQLKVYRLAREGGARLRSIADKGAALKIVKSKALYLKRGVLNTARLSARGMPLEHLAALSGEFDVIDADLLGGLRQSDLEAVEKHSDVILKQLRFGLRRLLCAGRGTRGGVAAGEAQAEEADADADAEVEAQIDDFTEDYVALVKIRLSLVPRSPSGALPHEMVHGTPVTTAAYRDFTNTRTAPEARRATELIKDGEHARAVVVRTLGTLPASFSVACTLVPLIVIAWVCAKSIQLTFAMVPSLSRASRALRPLILPVSLIEHEEALPLPLLSLALGLALALWCMSAFLSISRSRRWLDLTPADTWYEAHRRFRFAFYESVARQTGWAQPLERIHLPLEQRCQAVLGVWRGRLARRRYYEALHRGRIGARAAVLLIEDLCTARQARDNERNLPKKRATGWRLFHTRRRKKHHQPKATRARTPRFYPNAPPPMSTAALEAEEDEEDECADSTVDPRATVHEGSVLDEVVMPGTVAEAEAFLELEVEDDGDEDDGSDGAPTDELLEVFEEAFEEPLGRPFGERQCADAQHRLKDYRGSSKRKVKDVLKAAGWTPVRTKKHLVYKRTVGGRRQTFVASKTPSDRRATINQLKDIDRLEKVIDHELEPLRFPIGTRVECNCADCWKCGTVVDHRYYDNDEQELSAPYQVELDDGDLIYAPQDDDRFIRQLGGNRSSQTAVPSAQSAAQSAAGSASGGGGKQKKQKGGKRGGKRR